MNYQLSWNLCNTFIYMFIGLHSSHVVYLQKKRWNKYNIQLHNLCKKSNQSNCTYGTFSDRHWFSHRLVLQSQYKQRFQRITYFVCVYSTFLYLTISNGLYKVTILSLNSFFFTCSHLGFYLIFFPVLYLHSIPLSDTDLPHRERQPLHH